MVSVRRLVLCAVSVHSITNVSNPTSRDSMPTFVIDAESNLQLAYRVAKPLDKSKHTIVMFHSFLMDSQLYAPQFADARYDAYNLIAIDEHGHGGTTGRSTFTFWDTAIDSLKLLSALEITRFYVLGTSQGGFIAMRIALLAPERVQGLVLLGTSAFAETQENKVNFRRIRDKWCETEIPTEEALYAKSGSFGGTSRVGDQVYQRVKQMWIARHAGPAGYDPALSCLSARDSLIDRLSEIRAPVLVLHGTDDKVYSVEQAREWAGMLPNLYDFVVVDRGMHYLSFTEPGDEVCASLIPTFISKTFQQGESCPQKEILLSSRGSLHARADILK